MDFIVTACSYFTEFIQRQSISIPDHFAIRLQRLIAEAVGNRSIRNKNRKLQESMAQYSRSSQGQAVLAELNAIAGNYLKKLKNVQQQTSLNECGLAIPAEVKTKDNKSIHTYR